MPGMLESLLPLERPLVFFDTETTGTNPRADRIIEIACVKVHPDGHRERWEARFNPGIPIPAGSTAIHGIRDRDVAACPRFTDMAPRLASFLEGCDLAGYNITGFDLPVLRIEFLRAGVPFEISQRRLVDAQRIFFAREPRHLTAAARFYCQADHNGAHGALADAEMTLKVLAGELQRYPDLPRSVGELHDLFCAGLDQDLDPEGRFRLINGEPTVNFGRNRGRTLRAMSREEPGFLRWILKGDFSKPVKEIAAKFLPPDPQPTLGALAGVHLDAPGVVRDELDPPAQPEPAPAEPVVPTLAPDPSGPVPPLAMGETMDLFAALEEFSPPAGVTDDKMTTASLPLDPSLRSG
jgi:DNA polymerase III subunit epsilon